MEMKKLKLCSGWACALVAVLMYWGQSSGRAVAGQVLLFSETLGTSVYRSALDRRAYPYQTFADDASFNQTVQSADPGSDVVVVDAMGNYHDFSGVIAFVQSGGRALMQYWNVTAGSSVAAAFQSAVVQSSSSPLPVHNWGGSTLFAGLGSPLFAVESGFLTDALKLQPTAGAVAAAGFTSSATANQAALVIGNSGRTILHGFFIEDIETDADAVRLAENELDYLFGPLLAPAGPSINVQPQSQLVLVGGGITLRVGAGGSLPLSYQWQENGTNLPGATDEAYTITNAQFSESGSYSVVISNNQQAMLTSSVAAITVAPLGPITNVLLFVDGTLPSAYEEALGNLGLPYQRFTDDSSFGSAISASNPAETLAVVDTYSWTHHHSELAAFAKAGGRALLQYWNLTAGSRLASYFGVSVVQPNTSSLPVYDWGGSNFFDGVGSPLVFSSLFNVHGQKLQPLTGSRAVAGYTTTPSANQAAIVIGNSDRTVVNAFLLEEAALSSQAVKLVQNEIQYFSPLQPWIESVTPSNGTNTLLWTAYAGRNYQVQFKAALSDTNWADLGAPVSATDSTATQTDATGAPQRFYRVVLLP